MDRTEKARQAEEELRRLMSQLGDATKTVEERKNERERLQQLILNLQNDLDKAQRAYQGSQRELATIRASLEESNTEKSKIREQLKNSVDELQRLKTQTQSALSDARKSTGQIAEYEAQINTLKQNLLNMTAEKQQLTEKVRALQAELRTVKTK